MSQKNALPLQPITIFTNQILIKTNKNETNFYKTFWGGAICALLLVPSSAKAQTTLASWDFNTLYEGGSVDAETKACYYTPNTSGTYANIGHYWYSEQVPYFYPQTYVNGTQTDYYMTSASPSRYWQVTSKSLLNESSVANSITDYSDASSHKVYYEIKFPTTGYKDINLNFTNHSYNGVCGVTIVVSPDGGTTWMKSEDFAATSAATAHNVSLAVPNKTDVRVRFLCENEKTGYSYIHNVTITGTAISSETFYNVSAVADDDAHGTVAMSPVGGTYESGGTVTLSATPKAGWKFQKWNDGSSDVSTDNPYNYTVSGNKTITAVFEVNSIKRNVIYYDVDGTNLGTQQVTDGETIGSFAYTANPSAGYSFRGWYTAAEGGGSKVTTATVVGSDMSIYAYQTETETYGADKSYTFDFRTIENADYFNDHEAISISGGTRHGGQHGWYFYNNQPISILVAGNSKIYVSLCTYSPNVKLRITYPNGTTDECDADPDPSGETKDGEEHEFVYSGGTSGIATIATTSDYAYIHYIRIENSYGIVEVGNTGWATYITNEDVDFSGVTAYIVSSKTASSATLTEVASAPAGTPVLISGSEGEHILTSEASPVDVSDNKLQAATNAVTADGTQYILANGGSGIGFYKAKSGTTIAAGKAYLSSSAGSPALTFVFEGGTTGITDVKNSNTVSGFNFFNLKGQRVAQPTKGLYIVNGKKVIIK